MSVDRVAILGGTGEEGFGLASRWARAGIEIVIGSRDAGRADEAARRLEAVAPGCAARGAVNDEAAGEADVVCVTVPFSGQAALYRSVAERLRPDAVVIDCTVPLAAATGGRPWHTLGVWQGSAAQQALALVEGRPVCAAFHTLSASALNDLDEDLEGDVLVCGPRAAKPALRDLVEAIPRLRFVDAGGLDNARIVEPLTALLVGINRRYKTTRAGIRITGLP